MDEVVSDGLRPDAVILSVGGGSLLSGVARRLEKHRLSHIPVYAVDTEGAASLNAALKTGERVTLDRVSGIATTLAASKVCENAFNVARRSDVRRKVVSDDEAVNAPVAASWTIIVFWPACGVSLSMLSDGKIGFKPGENVLVIVSGGASITLESLQS